MELDGLTIRRRDDLERTGNWLLARRSLGLTAFGMNLVEIPPGERIPEHDETDRDQEEVFLVLERVAQPRSSTGARSRRRRARSRGSTRSSPARSSTAATSRPRC